jgi:hypothetical protein
MSDMLRLDELFNIKNGTNIIMNVEVKVDKSEGIPVVSTSGKNNGIACYIKRKSDLPPIKAGCLTVSVDGSVLSTFYQSENFYTTLNVRCLYPKTTMSIDEINYYINCIKMNKFKYSYGRKANKTLHKILVPRFNNQIKVDSLVDDARTKAKELISSLKTTPTPINTSRVPVEPMKYVRLDELFNIKNGANIIISNEVKVDKSEGIPVVSGLIKNNGVTCYIKRKIGVSPTKAGCLTVSIDSNMKENSILTTFYQSEEFYCTSLVKCLYPRYNFTMDELIYYAGCIKTNAFRYSRGRRPNKTLPTLKVPHPDCIPNYAYNHYNNCLDILSDNIEKII